MTVSQCQTLDRATFKRLVMPLEDKYDFHNEYIEQRVANVAVLDMVQSTQIEVVSERDAVLAMLQKADVAAEAFCGKLDATKTMREQVLCAYCCNSCGGVY